MSLDATERNRIASEVHRTWSDLTRELESFSEGELYVPNVIGIWSLKDLIGHLETWDRIAIRKLNDAEQADEKPGREDRKASAYESIDEFNEAHVVQDRSKSLATLWDELERTHAELLQRIADSPALTDELIREDTHAHYAGHLDDIRAWKSRQFPVDERTSPM